MLQNSWWSTFDFLYLNPSRAIDRYIRPIFLNWPYDGYIWPFWVKFLVFLFWFLALFKVCTYSRFPIKQELLNRIVAQPEQKQEQKNKNCVVTTFKSVYINQKHAIHANSVHAFIAYVWLILQRKRYRREIERQTITL